MTMMSFCKLFLVFWLSVITCPCSQAVMKQPTHQSYGTVFWIPFPGVTVGDVTSSFQYRIYLTNPNTLPVEVTVWSVKNRSTTTQILSVPSRSARFVAFDISYMMQGEGTFHKYVRLTGGTDFGVHVITTEKMDAFTALPVSSWGNSYMAVTYSGESNGPCQVIIISHVATQVIVKLPAKNENTVSISSSRSLASSQAVSLTLEPGNVYQLQRDYDITGAQIESNTSIGVLTGSANALVGKGNLTGAFMEFLPPVTALGSSYVAFLSPSWSGRSDFVRIVALSVTANVHISSGFQRFQLKKFQYITRRFDKPIITIEADQPIMVVKFSQSDQFNQNKGYPTMTIIPPTDQYLQGHTVVVSQVTGFTNTQQFVVLVGTSDFMQQINTGAAENFTISQGTNMAVSVVRMGADDFMLDSPATCNTQFMVYSYLVSDEVTFQIPVVFSQSLINQPCSVSESSPGDSVDNDCDGDIDEDACDSSNFRSYSDCARIISGDPDIWGKQFSLQIPDHCESSLDSDIVQLYVTARTDTFAEVTVQTPLDLTKIYKTLTMYTSDKFQVINLTGAAIKGNGSSITPDQTVHITSTEETSVTLLQVCTILGWESTMSTRLIPNDVLGTEYYVITLCIQDKCQVQVTAFHKHITEVRVRLRLKVGSTPFVFNSTEYKDGQMFTVHLRQYQSLQLQSDQRDLTGTHIISNKPVSVFSGGRYTRFKKQHVADGFVEQLPPVRTWGRSFIVQSSPVTKTINKCSGSPCLDYIKVVACTAETVVHVYDTSTTEYTLLAAGDWLEIPLKSVYATVKTTKPIMIMQLTQEIQSIALSGSIVFPTDQYMNTDRAVIPVLEHVDTYLMITADHVNPTGDPIMLNNIAVSMDTQASLNASFYSGNISGSNLTQLSSPSSSNIAFSGHVYFNGTVMAGMFPLAHGVTEINPVCVINKGVPGDNTDNDCDGQVDEEPCDPADVVKADVDNDAMFNEDCMSSPVSAIIQLSSAFSIMSTGIQAEHLTTLPSMFLKETSEMTSVSLAAIASDATKFSTPAYVLTPSSSSSMIASLSLSSLFATLSLLVSSTDSAEPSVTNTDITSSFSTAAVHVSIYSSTISKHNSNMPNVDIASPTSVVTNGIVCGCHCPSSLFTTIFDSDKVAQMMSAIKKELYLDNDDLSATRRKYISIGDTRPSAQTMGYFGVAIIISTIMGVFILDLGALTRDVSSLIRSLRGGD